jgi:hypothetical protein
VALTTARTYKWFAADLALIESLASRLGVSQTDVLRRGLRSLDAASGPLQAEKQAEKQVEKPEWDLGADW